MNRNQIADFTGAQVLGWTIRDIRKHANRPFTISANHTVARAPQRIVLIQELDRGRRTLVKALSRLKRLRKFLHRAQASDPSQLLALEEGVEIGAFRVFVQGRERPLTALHTSSRVDSIEESSLARSLQGVLNGNEVRPGEVRAIEYFHTHPAREDQISDPISADDEAMMRRIREWVGPEIALDCFAIASIGTVKRKHEFLYHMAA